MADDWIKIRIDLCDDPNVYILSDTLSIDVPTCVGHLCLFWGWMDRHTPDGKALKLTESVIDRRVGLPGFAHAMRKVGWLEGENMALTIPKFDRHNGNSAKARTLEAEAKRLRRKEKNASEKEKQGASKTTDQTMSDDVGQTVGKASDKKGQKCPTREEKRRIINNKQLIKLTNELSTGNGFDEDFTVLAPNNEYYFLHGTNVYLITRDCIDTLQQAYPQLTDVEQAIAELVFRARDCRGQHYHNDPQQTIHAWLTKRVELQTEYPGAPLAS